MCQSKGGVIFWSLDIIRDLEYGVLILLDKSIGFTVKVKGLFIAKLLLKPDDYKY